MLQVLLFLSTFNNVTQAFHLSNFNNIIQTFFSNTDQQLFLFQFASFTKLGFKDLNFFLQQFFNFSQNIYTSFSLFYISKLYKFLFFCLLVDNQVTELFKKFRNDYFRIEHSITQKQPPEVFYVKSYS